MNRATKSAEIPVWSPCGRRRRLRPQPLRVKRYSYSDFSYLPLKLIKPSTRPRCGPSTGGRSKLPQRPTDLFDNARSAQNSRRGDRREGFGVAPMTTAGEWEGHGMHLEKRVLVTGGAGFLGSHLCERLLERGANVICLDNF